jgi:hypothetical protein
MLCHIQLLFRGVDPNISGGHASVLYTAAQMTDVTATRLFLEYGGDPNFCHKSESSFLLFNDVLRGHRTVLYQAVFVLVNVSARKSVPSLILFD